MIRKAWLLSYIGDTVRVGWDDGTYTQGVLVSIGRNGCRVDFAGKTRVVAEWRIVPVK
jgi:hypothetical protein